MEAIGFCQRWLCIPGMQSDSWLPFGYPSYKIVFPVAKTIQHMKCGKVVEYQQVSAFYNTSENGKTTTCNEKVACSSQVTSSTKAAVFCAKTAAFLRFENPKNEIGQRRRKLFSILLIHEKSGSRWWESLLVILRGKCPILSFLPAGSAGPGRPRGVWFRPGGGRRDDTLPSSRCRCAGPSCRARR